MSFKFWALSSKEYYETLKSGEFSDTEILVGEVPDTKVFKLHSLILKVRSPYFRKALSGDKIKVENNIIKHEIPNISVKVFDILIKYIYNGTIDLTKNDLKTNIALLIAIGELHLNNLNSIISTHILKDQVSLKKNLVLIQHVTTKYAQFTGRLSGFYKTTIRQDPSMIFKTDDFVTINKDVLLNLVKNNKSLKQIEVWDKLKEWAIAQSRELPSDTEKWTSNEMTTFATTIKSFIPLINFKEISPADFSQKIKPFKSIFDIDFYVQILEYYSSNEIAHSKFKINLMIIDSGIISSDHAFLLCYLIKIALKADRNDSYIFKLLVRGSRDGFDLQTFHECCNDKGPTITVISVRDTNEILGGFNPYVWKATREYHLLEQSFIFSLDKNILTNFTFSKVVDKQHAVFDYGIDFGGNNSDLRLLKENTSKGQCYKNSYEKLIRQDEGIFEVDDFEVFQVFKKARK